MDATASPTDHSAWAMQQLDPQLRKEYDCALEMEPGMVQRETKFADFLRAEKGDSGKAAVCLARHWVVRKWLFGERWLLPMTQDGKGLLRPKEISLLRTGYFKVVESKVHGTVFVLDFSLLPSTTKKLQVEIIFYMFTVAACDVSVLIVLRGTSGRPGLRLNNEIRSIVDATATRIKGVYTAHAYEPGKERLHDFLADQQIVLTKMNFKMHIVGTIRSHSIAGTLQQLEQCGFDRSCVPRELGGNIDESTFHKWIRMRLSVEEMFTRDPVTVPGYPDESSALPLSLQASTRALVLDQRKQQKKGLISLTQYPGETDEAFHKRRNALYGRRRYHRQRMEKISAESEVARLQAANESLRNENIRLQCLLQTAMSITKGGSSTR